MQPVDVLVLGAGWTSTFLLPLLGHENLTHAATSTSGRPGTLPFRYDPDTTTADALAALPPATTILITFPLRGPAQSSHLTGLYAAAHPGAPAAQWVQLGTTGVFTAAGWNAAEDTAPDVAGHERAQAEDDLLRCGGGAVLHLAGLYGAGRDPRNWLVRVARSKDAVRAKGALHLVHGRDVARAVVAMHRAFTPGRRWIVTDGRVYDWWDLMQSWGAEARERERAKARGEGEGGGRMGEEEIDGLEYERWVAELMREEGVRALPRGVERLGRVLDGRAFWEAMGTWPVMGHVGFTEL